MRNYTNMGDQKENISSNNCNERMKEGGKQKRDIIIADRGFPSLAMFVNLKQMGYDFAIRYSGEQFLKELKEIVTNEKEEMINQ